MADVFISYAREDREQAVRLAAALDARGWSVWWDREIVTGQAYDQAIEHALANAGCVVVLWSRHSVASEWVKNEAAAGADRGVLLPALIEQLSPPLEFRRRQSADLTDWEGAQAHAGLRALCAAIQATLGRIPAVADAASPSPVARRTRRAVTGLAAAGVLLVVIGAYYAGSQRALTASTVGGGLAASVPAVRGTPVPQSVGLATSATTLDSPAATGTGPTAAQVLAPVPEVGTATRNTNLLAAENGGHLMAAPRDEWAAAIDGKLSDYGSVQVGEAAVFGFKDDKPASFDSFGILINNSGRNPKEIELSVADDSPTGTFRSIGAFHPENVKLFKTGGWQDFRFPAVTARYLKVRLKSNFEDVVWIELVEFRLIGTPTR